MIPQHPERSHNTPHDPAGAHTIPPDPVGATIGKAVTLALGIGIQNFPEGLAVSMPLMREGVSPLKSFW